MSDWQLKTPVAFLIFNRPETTRRVFEEIARARPPRLFIVADGPRAERRGEAERCAQTRSIVERVDWPCEVVTNYSEVNLGCKARVSSGLDWLFAQVDEAVILEDDCLPHPSFFRFCEELLERYRHDERVGMISGDNFQFGRRSGDGSYYFSKYTHIWGWATWRRAWKHYDVSAKRWPQFLSSGDFARVTMPMERSYWKAAYAVVNAGRLDTWDYQWTLTCWIQSMLAVMPEVNLVSNIGFGPSATHTVRSSQLANMATAEVTWPLREPSIVAANLVADQCTAKIHFSAGYLRMLAFRLFSYLRNCMYKMRMPAGRTQSPVQSRRSS
jgi:hypothetical protein